MNISPTTPFRVGLGKDSHRFVESDAPEKQKKPLILGGVRVPGSLPFVAHSDGDVVYHALFNAISSALGGPSIGAVFPDTEEAERDRDSADYLKYIAQLLHEAGARIGNISIVLECKRPKIDPLSDEMKQNISDLLHCSTHSISITATTGEGVTPWGQGVGVEVLCSVLLLMAER